MRQILVHAVIISGAVFLAGCEVIELKPGYTAYIGRQVGEQSGPDVVGTPETQREINNSGRFSGDREGKASRPSGRGEDGISYKPAPPTTTPPVAPAPTPAPSAPGPTLDLSTLIGQLGTAWENLKRPQPIDQRIGRNISGIGVAVDMLQQGFDTRVVREASKQIEQLRSTMGPGEVKIIHIRQTTDAHAKVYEVPKRFEPILKAPGEKVFETEIVTPEVIIKLPGGVKSFFTSTESIHLEAKAQYDKGWAEYYRSVEAKIDEILAPPVRK